MVWQLGVINLLGFGIDPMSILVPFLVFAIAVSHGMQMISSFGSEVFDGADAMTALIAASVGGVVAELKMVPNQPLTFHGDGQKPPSPAGPRFPRP